MDALLTKTKPVILDSASNISGAEALLRGLVAEKTEIIFGYPGGAIMPVYDALYHFSDQLNHILVRHEQGAIHAAQGFARASGKPGVVFATSGPGATNLVTGLADALIDSTPLVCITGQVFAHLLGTDAFQETDVVNTTIPVTKWNAQVTEAKDIAPILAKAFHIAVTGRPGPVLVDITKNAQNEILEYFEYSKCESIRTYKPKPIVNETQLLQAAELINSAKRPYILAGQGILLSGATDALVAFSEKTGIPVACTLLGLGAFPANHPNYVGYLGMHGNYGPNLNTNKCDVLIGIGMRFDDRVTGNVSKYAKQAKVVHIDIDKAEINKIITANVAVHADAREALERLIDLTAHAEHLEWKQSFAELNAIEYKKVIHPELTGGNELRMSEAVHAISTQTEGDAIVVTDVGQHQMVTSRYYHFRHPRTHITSGGAGTMGFALPAALGAALAATGKTVIAVIGDGGYQMTIQELGTIMQYKIPVKIVVLNNNFLGMVRQWQELFHGKRYSFTEMSNPDFIRIAEAYDITAMKITSRDQLESGIRTMLKSDGPFFLEVVVGREDNVFPMVPAGAGVSEVLLEAPEKSQKH